MVRRRRRSMFASSGPSRRTSASWLEPGRSGRRRRRGRGGGDVRWGAWLIGLLLLGGIGAGAYFYLDHRAKVDDQRATAKRFFTAYARGDARGMYAELDARTRAAYPFGRFAKLTRDADRAAVVER